MSMCSFTFRLRTAELPLFGCVEAKDKLPFHDKFSASSGSQLLEINEAGFETIAEELELDAPSICSTAYRYISGDFRQKAKGMDGSQLGDFGEVLAYLIRRGLGDKVTRVVGWKLGPGQTRKGGRFPQPDFLVQDAGASDQYVLEVKSTQAFDFKKLQAVETHKYLQPCSAVFDLRREALPQLGWNGRELESQKHFLRRKAGGLVPFPAKRAVAVAVLVRDGRVQSLISDPRFKTPPTCGAMRKCWDCASSHAVVVTMPNSPGRLALLAQPESPESWFAAYSRWVHAVWAAAPKAISASTRSLAEMTGEWLSATDTWQHRLAEAFWGSYLLDTAASVGFAMEDEAVSLRTLHEIEAFEWVRAPVVEKIESISGDRLWQAAVDASREGRSARFVLEEQAGAEHAQRTLTVSTSREGSVFSYLSPIWWKGKTLENDLQASDVALELLKLVWPSSHAIPQKSRVPLEKAVASFGGRIALLGWRASSAPADRMQWHELMRHMPSPWPFFWVCTLSGMSPWMRLSVFPDGRARVRIHRDMPWI